MAHFTIENLSFSYPTADKEALRAVSVCIEKGQYIALCGKSGSGKTTLLRHLKSVLTPHGKSSGTILFEGQDLAKISLRDQSEKIGYVMQNPDQQIVTDKVWHELAFGLESLGYDQRTIRLRVAEMASYFGIQTWFHKKVTELSGGQKQLLNLASIMAMQPQVLILDEPTSQLDPIAAADFLNTVRKINRELGTTVIISEHRLEDVVPVSDRVIVMEKGEIIADDAPEKIGDILLEQKSDMLVSLPSPMQIFYGFQKNLPKEAGKTKDGSNCPLTVREGRKWLSDALQGQNIRFAELEEDKKYQEPETPVLSLKEVWFRYEKNGGDILKGVDLAVEKGSMHAIVGGNGTGKTTMLKALCGIIKPYRGKILIKGRKLEKYGYKELFRGGISMLPQDPQSIFVKKTVQSDLEEMLTGLKLSKEEKVEKIAKVAKECEIEALLNSHPFDLSGGEQQRAALAKVLLCEPEILLLDEPTKGIDNFFKISLAKILAGLKARSVTILMVSHDVEFCAKYADYVSMFFDGGVITTNTPQRFFAKNSFYTTAANRMSRHIFVNAVTNEEVVELCRRNQE